MKNILTVLFAFFIYSANAANYYFSSVSGDDARTPAQARSAATPWKTLSKLNSFFISLQPGDSILLKRGDTFLGSIIATKSGTPAAPIVIGTYGSGNKPVITSLISMGGWVSKGNGIWESKNLSLGATVNTVLINNTEQQIGRYPNSDAFDKGYLTFESHGSNSITDIELNTLPDWTGAELVLRTRRWVLDRCLITSHTGNKISYIASSAYGANDGYGYFIQNDIKTLDKFGEWYFNPFTDILSVYFGSNDPTSYVVQAATIDNLVSASGISNLVFDNLNVKGANADGFNIKNGSNINIKNCDVMFSGVNGMTVKFHNYIKIENCTISNSNDNGIDLGYSGDFAIIRNNKITNTSVFAGMGGSGDGEGFGIRSSGNGSVIEYNQIINTGSSAISFNGDQTVVKNNYINGYCLIKDDGSGIYTFTGSANTNRTGRKVIGNIVMNGIGAAEGVNVDKPLVEGIYMDDNASGVEISGNTVANIPGKGIFLHNARNITILNNTVYNNEVQLSFLHDTKGDAIRNCTVTKNNFFSKFAIQNILNLRSNADDNSLIGRFDSNYYARPIDDRIIINNSYVNNAGTSISEDLDLDGWKDKYNKDEYSQRTGKQILNYTLNALIGANKVPNGSFTSNVNGVLKTSCTADWSNASMLDGGYLQVTPLKRSSSVYMRIGGLTSGKKYLLKYSVRGSVNDNMTISTYLKNDVTPYNNLTPVQTRKLTTTRTENEVLFYVSSSENITAVVFNVNNATQYYLDNIQVYEADAGVTNVDDSLRFEYNETLVNKTVILDGNYVDAKNNKYYNSIVLQPFTSAILIKDGVSINVVPSANITSPSVNATFTSGTSVIITTSAADSDGTISKVEFYNGEMLLGADTTSPYTFTWNNVTEGTYSISAKATDNNSAFTSSAAVAFTVYTPNVAPSADITSPAVNATFVSGTSVVITAAAADLDGKVSKVEFYNGETFLGADTTSPYVFTWNNAAAGTYSILAKATDDSSAVTSSAAVSFTVYTPNVAPSANITSPAVNTSFASGTPVVITAAAADSDGKVSKVEFYNGEALLGTDTTSPYTFTWNNVAAGTYSILAKATDDSSAVTSSAAVAFIVYTPNVAPSVSLTSPVATTTYNGPATISISADANDNDGTISKVEFYRGTTLLKAVFTAPYKYSWTNVAAGNYTLTAKATDNNGTVTTSEAVSVTVLPNIAPVVAITSPVISSRYAAGATINISATATDLDGTVSKVEFYNGATLLRIEKVAPYSYAWANVLAGNYTLIAKATDNKGTITTSAAITFTVAASTSSRPIYTNYVETAQHHSVKIFLVEKETSVLKVYPNPATSKIQMNINELLKTDHKATVQIQNISGITLKNFKVIASTKTLEVDISSLPAGFYTISIIGKDYKVSRKFVKS